MKVIIALISLLLFSFDSSGQLSKKYIRQNALPLSSIDNLNESVYKQLKDFRAILIGEMHGTSEPAELVIGLAKMFSTHGKQVIIGVEISEDALGDFPNS